MLLPTYLIMRGCPLQEIKQAHCIADLAWTAARHRKSPAAAA
jgi:hypothetical protein